MSKVSGQQATEKGSKSGSSRTQAHDYSGLWARVGVAELPEPKNIFCPLHIQENGGQRGQGLEGEFGGSKLGARAQVPTSRFSTGHMEPQVLAPDLYFSF